MGTMLRQVQCQCAACRHFVIRRTERVKDSESTVRYVQNEDEMLCLSCAETYRRELGDVAALEKRVLQPRLEGYELNTLGFLKRKLAQRPIPEATRRTSTPLVFGEISTPRGALAMYSSVDAQLYYEWLRENGWVVEIDPTHREAAGVDLKEHS